MIDKPQGTCAPSYYDFSHDDEWEEIHSRIDDLVDLICQLSIQMDKVEDRLVEVLKSNKG